MHVSVCECMCVCTHVCIHVCVSVYVRECVLCVCGGGEGKNNFGRDQFFTLVKQALLVCCAASTN